MITSTNPEALAGLERARLLFAEMRNAPEALVKATLKEIAPGVWRADVTTPGPFVGDYEYARHETESGAVNVLGETIRSMAEKRHADLGRALDAYDADPTKTPRRAGRGRK